MSHSQEHKFITEIDGKDYTLDLKCYGCGHECKCEVFTHESLITEEDLAHDSPICPICTEIYEIMDWNLT